MLTYPERFSDGDLFAAERVVWPNADNPISVLLPRYCLRFDTGHPMARPLLEKTISKMFAVYSPRRRSGPVWMHASYPSEPFLANLCAERVHGDEFLLQAALRDLRFWLDRGLILTEPHHRLESRLILLSCKDCIAERLPEIGTYDIELRYCRMVPVIDYLEALFGPECWPSDEGSHSKVKAAFPHASVNFSHWIMMDTELGKSGSMEPLSDWKYVLF